MSLHSNVIQALKRVLVVFKRVWNLKMCGIRQISWQLCDSLRVHLGDSPLWPSLIGWNLASRTAPRFQSIFCVILILRNTSEKDGMRFSATNAAPRDPLWDTSRWPCISSNWVSPWIRFNTAGHPTNLDGQHAFPASFSNSLTHSYASSYLSSFIVSCYYTFRSLFSSLR